MSTSKQADKFTAHNLNTNKLDFLICMEPGLCANEYIGLKRKFY